jgi:hypothetical protein
VANAIDGDVQILRGIQHRAVEIDDDAANAMKWFDGRQRSDGHQIFASSPRIASITAL